MSCAWVKHLPMTNVPLGATGAPEGRQGCVMAVAPVC
jgi:hypothetical protein